MPSRRSRSRAAARAPWRTIDRLSPKLKTVVLLRFYEEMQLSEIAEITGTNLSTVKSRLYKGLKKLRESLQEG